MTSGSIDQSISLDSGTTIKNDIESKVEDDSDRKADITAPLKAVKDDKAAQQEHPPTVPSTIPATAPAVEPKKKKVDPFGGAKPQDIFEVNRRKVRCRCSSGMRMKVFSVELFRKSVFVK